MPLIIPNHTPHEWRKVFNDRSVFFRCPSNYFIVSLAFSDIMMGLAYALYNVSHMELPEVQQVLGNHIF